MNPDLSKGISPADFSKMGGTVAPADTKGISIDDFNKAGGQAVSTPDTTSQGFDPDAQPANMASGFLKDALKPLWQGVATANQLVFQVKDLSHDIFHTPGLTEKEQQQLSSQSYDFGSLGSVKSWQNPLQAAGGGAQLASYIVPLGPEAQGAKWITNLLRMSAPFAITQTVGGALSDVGEGKSGGATLGDAALNYLGSVAGMAIFKGLSSGLKATAGVLLKSEIVKSANMATLDFVNRAMSLDGRFAQGEAITAKDAALQTKALQNAYEPVHKQAMDAFAQTVQTPTTWDDVYRGVQDKVSNFFDGMVKAKDARYADVFTETMVPNANPTKGFAQPTFEALDRAKAITGAGALPEAGAKMSPADFNAAQDAIANQDSPLAKYVSLVESKIGTADKPKPLSMKDFDQLFTSAPIEGDPKQNKAITDISTSLYESAKSELAKSSDPEAAKTLQAWNEARTQWLNVRKVASTKFFGDIKSVGDAQAFVENMMSSKPSVYTQKIIDGLDADTKGRMSDIIYNMALQRSRTMNANYSVGGKAVQDMLDRWSPTGLIDPLHESVLRSYSQAMQGTYDDAAQMLGRLTGSEFEDTGASAAMKTAQESQIKATAAADLQKAMGSKDLYKVNDDGTYDFTNLAKTVDKINNSGEYDQLAKYLSTVDSLENVASNKLSALVKGTFGAFMFHQHPFVGLGLISSSLSQLTGKDAAKITSSDISKLTGDLIKTGKLNPEGFTKFLTAMISGDFKSAGGILAKFVTGGVTKTATDTVNPAPTPDEMPDWFTQGFKDRTGSDATPDHWADFNSSIQQ